MKIEILDIRFMKSDKATHGFADICIGNITIKDFRIYHNGSGKPFVRNPFSTYKDQDGTLKFREIISLPRDVEAEVHTLILSQYFRRLKEKTNDRQSQ